MGRNVGDGIGGFQWWYLLGFPLVSLFRMAQISFSLFKFLVMFMIGDIQAVAQVLICFWCIFGYIKLIGQHLLATFRWLVWLFTYFKVKFYQNGIVFLVMSIRFEQVFTGYVIFNKNKNDFWVYDERIPIFCSVRIHAHLVYIFCSYTPWDVWKYHFNIHKDWFYKNLLEDWSNAKPPWLWGENI